jgi:hypothetical protein
MSSVGGDRSACTSAGLATPDSANFFTFNEVCKNSPLDSLFAGIQRHEGFGTPPSANGHEVRRQGEAALPSGDPRAAVEHFVRSTAGLLESAVTTGAWSVDQNLAAAADGATHGTPHVRRAAANWLTVAGESVDGNPAVPGVVDRLRTVYFQSTDVVVRTTVVAKMVRQADRPAAIDFLEEVAVERTPLDSADADWPPALWAVQTLSHLGSEGEAVLRRLYEVGSVHHPRARSDLERLSRQGFRGNSGR